MIQRFYVQGYRCLESVTFDFTGRPSSLIIGRNGSGKSTTRTAFSIIQRICRGSNRVEDFVTGADFTFWQTNRPMRFEIDVTLGRKLFKYAVSFEWEPKAREARLLDESLDVDGQAVFTRQQAQIQLVGGDTFGLDWHVFALPVINERPPHRALQDLKAFLASLILIAPVPGEMTGFSEQPSVELKHDASNYASCLRALLEKKPAAYAHFDAYVRQVIPDFSSIENADRGKDGKQLKVTFKRPQTDQSMTVEFDALSDGEKCIFLIAYIIASNAAGIPVVCFWDEPDHHLSLSEVGQFITELRKTAHCGGQFIATSHHPETVRKFSDDTTIVLTRKSHLDPALPKLLKDFEFEGDLVNALIRDEIIG
jgi:predicted ATPase